MRWSPVVVGASLCASTTSFASPPAQPQLRLLDRTPIVVRGTAFEPRERIRVDLWRPGFERRRVVATTTGAFKVAFAEISAGRCELIRAVAVGGRGSHASLKLLPPAGCHTG